MFTQFLFPVVAYRNFCCYSLHYLNCPLEICYSYHPWLVMHQRNKGRRKCGPGHRKENSEQEKHSSRWRKSRQAVPRKYHSQGHLGCLDFPHHRGGGLNHSAKISKERAPEKAGGHGVTWVTDNLSKFSGYRFSPTMPCTLIFFVPELVSVVES